MDEKSQSLQAYEVQADGILDAFLEDHTKNIVDDVEMWEKRVIIKEIALGSRKREIVRALNAIRKEKGLPELNANFDLYFYQTQYAEVIETLSLHYAKNLTKRFRFANRLARIAKLNDISEHVLDRIQQADAQKMSAKDELRQNARIKIFALLMSSIDDSMGKLVIPIDREIKKKDQPNALTSKEDVAEAVREALKQQYRGQLPDSVEAQFKEFSDYENCEFAEQFGEIHHCWYHTDQCKVQKEEVGKCPFYMNRTLLRDKDYMNRRYVDDRLSARQIAEIAGAKDADEKVEQRVKSRLKDHGIQRN